ncbi:hypothetical protein K525DRAFT_195668 [Schizophyllum commune Loenen D]|nr:hypothetical protein K525DRAFT_195668 [Schizophyllum commune Loenen D]
MNRSHDPTLPLELQLCILESLQDDKRAMAMCGLVCRTWVSPTRRALFEKITLLYHDRATFMDLLSSPHAAFADHVEALSIVGDSTLTGSAKFHDVLAALSALSAIHTLQLAHIDVSTLDDASLSLFHSSFVHIDTLKLDYVRLASPATLARFLAGFAGLRHLRLCASFAGISSRPLDVPLPSFRLESLTYTTQDYSDLCGLMSWFTLSDLSRLERLDIGPIPRTGLLDLAKLMRASDGGLRHLAIRMLDTVTSGDIADCLDFAAVPLLQSLQVFVSLPKFGQHRGSSALALLPCVGSRLSQLTLLVSASSPLELNRFDWGALNAALAGWQYRALRDLHVDVACFRDPQKIASTVRDRMGAFDQRGILRVEVKVL